MPFVIDHDTGGVVSGNKIGIGWAIEFIKADTWTELKSKCFGTRIGIPAHSCNSHNRPRDALGHLERFLLHGPQKGVGF